MNFTIIPGTIHNKVAAIKALRSLTRIGLKEAKDAVERTNILQNFEIRFRDNDGNTLTDLGNAYVQKEFNTLINNGVEVKHTDSFLVFKLKELQDIAKDAGEHTLAQELEVHILFYSLRDKKVAVV